MDRLTAAFTREHYGQTYRRFQQIPDAGLCDVIKYGRNVTAKVKASFTCCVCVEECSILRYYFVAIARSVLI